MGFERQSEYDPSGKLISKSGLMADVNKYRFSSKEWEPNTGLYYYGYRFYDPNLQRWPNRDPLGEQGFEATQMAAQPLYLRRCLSDVDERQARPLITSGLQGEQAGLGGQTGDAVTPLQLGASMLSVSDLDLNAPDVFGNGGSIILLGPNAFEFLNNNPINCIDPNGEFTLISVLWTVTAITIIAVVIYDQITGGPTGRYCPARKGGEGSRGDNNSNHSHPIAWNWLRCPLDFQGFHRCRA